MKNILSLTIFALLFLGLGALALTAAPGGEELLSPASIQGEALAEAAAPSAVKINEIALPLDVQSSFANASLAYDADGLAENIASGVATVSQVSQWNEAMQIYDTWDPVNNIGTIDGALAFNAFPLKTGEAYGLTVNQSSTEYTIVGDVPNVGTVKHTWTGAASCKLNNFGIPLDQTQSQSGKDLSDADKLAKDISPLPNQYINQVLNWNAPMQIYDTWDPINGIGTIDGALAFSPFATKIGYPYWICANSGLNNQQWP